MKEPKQIVSNQEEKSQNRKTAIVTSLKGVIYLVLVMLGIFGITSLMKMTGLSMVDQADEMKEENAQWEETRRVKEINKNLQLKPVENNNENEGIADLPLRMYLNVLNYEDGILQVQIDNQSGYKMEYREFWTIEYEENDIWQQKGSGFNPKAVSEADEKVADEDQVQDAITAEQIKPLLLLDLTKASLECDLNQLGELKAGNYRIRIDDLEAYFTLEEVEE